jgi:MinD superfamily P-loop ATPase
LTEIVILSGKGGTGKTTLLASYAALAKNTVLADCDVDAPNLHLLLKPHVREKGAFVGSKIAHLSGAFCKNCGECVPLCRFGAIKVIGNQHLKKTAIDEGLCEGCGVCSRVCEYNAITMKDRVVGEWFVSDTRFGTMVHALLEPGAENSGKLVAFVRQKAKLEAKRLGRSIILVDGPPGIGCPVISALSGTDLAVLVAEPTQSGASDFGRIAELAKGFAVPAVLIVNRYDLNESMTESIELQAKEAGIVILGRIPYDEAVVNAMADGKTVMESGSGKAARAIEQTWEAVLRASGASVG